MGVRYLILSKELVKKNIVIAKPMFDQEMWETGIGRVPMKKLGDLNAKRIFLERLYLYAYCFGECFDV